MVKWAEADVLKSCYIICCVVATWFCGVAAEAQFGGAQQPAGAGFPDAGLAAMAAPSADETLAGFRYVRGRVLGEGQVPEAPAMAGAAVVLRLHGEIVGRGWSLDGERALEAATDAALEELERRLPLGEDALAAEQRQGMMEEVAISLEAAGPAVPLALNTYDEADLVVSPGVQGVAVRQVGGGAGGGAGRVEAVFPGQMLLTRVAPSAAFTSCVAALSGDASLAVKGVKGHEAAETAREKGYTFLHFRVTHLAQGDGALTPSFVYRGARVISRGEMSTQAMRAWRDALAMGVVRGVRDGTVVPEYDFARNVQGREAPGPEVSSLVALALADYARAGGDGGATRDEAVKTAAGLLEPVLKDVEGLRRRPRALGQAATALAALSTLRLADAGGAIGLEAAHPGAREALLGVIHEAMTPEHAWKAGSGDAERGLAAWALALNEDGLARAAVVATLREAPGGKLMGAMPWVLYAAGLEKEMASGAAMRDLRDVLTQAQLSAGQCDPDEEGAIMFSRGGGVRPTWQSARGSLFLAGMLGDTRLTEDKEILRRAGALLASLRYLRQLTVDESMAWIAVDPARAEWTVRPALWEMTSSPEAGAVTLMSATRSLEAMQAAVGRVARRATGEATGQGAGQGATGR